jgi:hypothetical protein
LQVGVRRKRRKGGLEKVLKLKRVKPIERWLGVEVRMMWGEEEGRGAARWTK